MPNIPLPSPGASGPRPNATATATCLCGAIQLSFPICAPGLITTFICHCTDCHKISSSTYCSNFSVLNSHLIHVRGEEKLSRYVQSRTIASGATMEDSFCKACGNLMYRRSSRFPEVSILRIGTVDDFEMHEKELRPRFEMFTKDRTGWVGEARVEGIKRYEGARL